MARQLLDASQPEACFSDGLGLRFVRTLGTGETVEALRLRPELAAFRGSIRDRMIRLASFRQTSFPPVRDTAAVPHQAGCLEVISDYVPGIRLSDILEAAGSRRLLISTTAALHVVRGLLGALAVLAQSRAVAHGAVGPERVLLTPNGRLIVTDYVYGQALERLEYGQAKLWRVCRIPVPSGARAPSFDTRADLLQVGLVAVALLLGRPVEGDEFPGHLDRLAGSLRLPFDGDRRGKVERSVKAWLGRMLETDASRPFSGAREALTALEEALASQRQAQGQASPIRLLVNSYELAMAGPDGRAILACESEEAPAAISQSERPTPDGDFTREIQVESIAQPPKMFETREAGLKSTPLRRRTVAAADREDSSDAARISRPRGVVVRRVVSRGLGLAAAGFLLPVRVCFWAFRAAFSVAKHAVSAVAATLSSAGSGVRAILSALFAGVRGAASGALLIGRFSGGLVTSIAGALRDVVSGAGTMVRALGRGAGTMVRGVLTHLDAAGGGAICAAQVALRRTGGFAASIFPAIFSAAGSGIRTALSGAAVIGRSLGRACGRAFVDVARGAGRGAAAAAQAAGRGGGATISAMGVGSVRVIVATMWLMRATAAAFGAFTAAMVRGAAALGRLLRRRVWPAGLATLSVAGRVVVSAGRAARLGAIRLSPQPELRLQLLASLLVLLVTVYGIQLVKTHWRDGVAVAAQVSRTLTSDIKLVDLREWWPARQRRNGPKAPDGDGRLARTPFARSTGTGTVTVSSIPDGAEIWLDGELQGRAPITLDGVSAGAHTVLVRGRTGAVRRAVRVQSGGTSEVAINIYSGWLVVFAPIGLEVLENGRSIGTSETGRIRLSPGEHRLEIVSERVGFRESRTSEVKPGETVVINVELPPAMLEISAPPDTEVLVDGRVIGTTPTEPVPVAVGTREVTLRHPTLGEQRQTATITYRTPNRILFRPPG